MLGGWQADWLDGKGVKDTVCAAITDPNPLLGPILSWPPPNLPFSPLPGKVIPVSASSADTCGAHTYFCASGAGSWVNANVPYGSGLQSPLLRRRLTACKGGAIAMTRPPGSHHYLHRRGLELPEDRVELLGMWGALKSLCKAPMYFKMH